MEATGPKADVLRGEINTRTHFIHCAMALADGPLPLAEISRRAEIVAHLVRYPVKPNTFASGTTGSHLNTMRRRGFAEQAARGR